MCGTPGHGRSHRAELDAVQWAARGHIPDAQRLICGDRGEPLTCRVHSDSPDQTAVALVGHRDVCGEGTEVLGARQLRQQALRIYIHPLLQRPGHQVQVQAPLEALRQELWESRHMPEAIVLLWQVSNGPLRLVQVLPSLLLLLREEVLGRWVVGLRVPRQRQLRRRQRRRKLPALRRILAPEVPDLRLGRWRRPDLALAKKRHKLFDMHALPLRRQEPPLGWVSAVQRVDSRLGVVKFHHGSGVRGQTGVHPLPDAPDDLQVCVCEHDLPLVLVVLNGAPCIGVVLALKQGIDLTAGQSPHDLLTGKVVANMVFILVPLQWHVAYAVPRCIVLGVVRGAVIEEDTGLGVRVLLTVVLVLLLLIAGSLGWGCGSLSLRLHLGFCLCRSSCLTLRASLAANNTALPSPLGQPARARASGSTVPLANALSGGRGAAPVRRCLLHAPGTRMRARRDGSHAA
mmetsp:Transcript_30237/g.96592  ORF Transcript_30237/g.96592 Transcript_30237/m.96592 type:complete len:458 (-) Transcript_30237:20-1393(-)